METIKKRLSKLPSNFILSFLFIVLMTVSFFWFLISYMFNEVVQGLLYPYSGYPVIVYSTGEIIILPGAIVLCLAVFFGANHIALILFEKSLFAKIQKRLIQIMAIMLCVSVISVAGEFVMWPIAAKANGYSSCPYDTLLFGQKMSTAWSKKEAFCYDKGVQARLSTGTFEQVVQVAKYLDSKRLDKKD